MSAAAFVFGVCTGVIGVLLVIVLIGLIAVRVMESREYDP